ncbi:MAG: class I SAM-dependent methyltransferase [Halieaceae bacterium]|nr:class I SAM-dependent methyltransferase [Halieaceae bacterium]
MKRVAVVAACPALHSEAASLADELSLPLSRCGGDFDGLLELSDAGLSLRATGKAAPGPLRVDFSDPGLLHRRRSGHNEPLGRALGLHKWPGMAVVDATAGLGRESFVMADLGARVTMLERHPVVFALLRDGLRRGRASDDPRVAGLCQRLELFRADSVQWLQGRTIEGVYLDPMFPPSRKSARAKKGMWLFQQLLESGVQDDALLAAALASSQRRVVVKRPLKAAPLQDLTPGFSLAGKTVRFDVYAR